jgi:dihydroorotase
MSTGRTAYTNARLLDPATGLDSPGALLTEGGRIADLGPRLFADGVPDGVEAIDCEGLCLAPGLVDTRALLGEPGAEHKETIATGTEAAATGGVTTVISTPDTDPVIDTVALVEFLARQAEDSARVRVRSTAAVTTGLKGQEMTEMGMLAEAGAVALSDGFQTICNSRVMRRALSYASHFDLLICHHTEDPELAADGCMNEGEVATRLGLLGIPCAAETIMIERDMRLVELTGGRYHASGVSTPAAAETIRGAKARGLDVSCAVAPPHFALNENEVGHYRTFAKVSPPLRGEADRQGIVEALRDGTIDIISSAHAPEDPESKRRPFAQAAFGSVGLETLLPITLELYHNGSLGLLDALAKVTCNPARRFGLEAGALEKGAPADLVVFGLDVPWKIDAGKLRSRAENSAFDGRPVQGRAMRTVVEGRTIYRWTNGA